MRLRALERRRRFCDAGSGFVADAADHVVPFAFKPSPGATRIVVLAADCAKVKLADVQEAKRGLGKISARRS